MSDTEGQDWLANADSVESIQAVVCDLNGILRGKRVPIGQAKKVLEGGIRMPLSIVGVDVWGEDIVGSSQVFASGDMDGICSPTGRGALPVNWTLKPSAVVPLWLFKETGEPFLADPRQALAHIVRQYHELGLRPVVASEMEFYLIDSEPDHAEPPISPTPASASIPMRSSRSTNWTTSASSSPTSMPSASGKTCPPTRPLPKTASASSRST